MKGKPLQARDSSAGFVVCPCYFLHFSKCVCRKALIWTIVVVVVSSSCVVVPAPTALSASTITITKPNGTENLPESGDFAVEMFADPWDMSNLEDVSHGHYNGGITDFTLMGGQVSGRTTNTDPAFHPLFPCYEGTNPTNRDGYTHRIDTSQYDACSFRMYSSAGSAGQLYWFYNQWWTDYGVAPFWASAGWQTYNVDLSSNPGWTGTPLAFRFDPGGAAGVDFVVDWIKLYRRNEAGTRLEIAWTDSSPGGGVSIYVDKDQTAGNGNEDYVAWRASNASNTYQWDYSAYPAGTYYIYMVKGADTSAHSQLFTINQSPLVRVLEPDESGGADYATIVSGDPWDMEQMSDAVYFANTINQHIEDGVLVGYNTNGDSHFYLRVPTPIDTYWYHRATVRMGYDDSFDYGLGTNSRFYWNPFGMRVDTFDGTYDIVTYPEWFVYSINLKTCKRVIGGVPWSGWMTSFRFDPTEVPSPRRWYVDYIKLAADDAATTSFPIQWEDYKASPLPTTVSLYYDMDNQSFDGTLIQAGINQVAGANTYTWNCSSVPAGIYWIYLVATDGISTHRTYSTGPVRVMDGYYVVDVFGGLHPKGGAPHYGNPYWSGQALAKDIEVMPNNSGYYILDRYGGVHARGGAVFRGSPHWTGHDIARAIAVTPTGNGYYVLDCSGGVHTYGDAVSQGSPYWPGQDVARDIVLTTSGSGYYILDKSGGIHTYGDAVSQGSPYWPGQDVARRIAPNQAGDGYYVLDAFGGVHARGNVTYYGSPYWSGQPLARDIAVAPSNAGYYVLDAYGGVHCCGNASYYSAPAFGQGYACALAVWARN